jgi:hypothetical protein
VDIEASARKHGVSDDDMLHALRHHWRGFETDDADVTMFIGRPRAASRWKSVSSMTPTASRSSMQCRLDPSS